MNIQIEVGSKVKVGLTIIGLISLGVLTYIGTKKIKAHNEKLRIKREAEEAEFEKVKKEFENILSVWKGIHDEAEVSKLTLQNETISAITDRSYLYSKLNARRLNVINSTLSDYKLGLFDEKVNKYDELANACQKEDKTALDARILAMRDSDENFAKEQANRLAKAEQERKYQHELDILKEKHDSELEMYKAKAETEKAKMNSLAKALKSSDNKSLNTSFNIKTNINED